MAGGGQELKRRIRSVQNTQQITRAMKLVAGAKLRRAQERAERTRGYFETIQDVMHRAAEAAGGVRARSPLLRPPTGETVAYLVVTSDRGLAGPFNANLIRYASQLMREDGPKTAVFAVGRKARDAFRRRGVPSLGDFVGLGDEPHYYQAKAIADAVIAAYLDGEVGRVRLVYAQFVNPMIQRPTVVDLLPMQDIPSVGGAREPRADAAATLYLFEPDPETVLADLVPRYLEVLVYGALLESKASEHGARMTAMDAATKNSEELLRTLTLTRNRLRQAAITKEIAELVGGAAALE
jgi:F-type H+-transporting ATPase subunit gamma